MVQDYVQRFDNFGIEYFDNAPVHQPSQVDMSSASAAAEDNFFVA